MKGIIQIDSIRKGMPALRNCDLPLRMYYDETNNIRRLTLSETGLTAPDNRTFVIGGVAIPPDRAIIGWDDLRASLRIQRTATEIKYEHIAPKDYEEALMSDKLLSFLSWLEDKEFLLHYSSLDVLHWSIVDIIDSLACDERIKFSDHHLHLKSELYHAATFNSSAFMNLLQKFSYPNVERGSVSLFLSEISKFVESSRPYNRNHFSSLLKKVLKQSWRLPGLELPFLHENRSGELIDNFSVHFLHCVCMFKNSSHIFDTEKYVERILSNIELREGSRILDYRFVDSKSEVGVQLSDVVCGLLGRHFSYIQSHSLSALRERKSKFKSQQLATLYKLRDLLLRSDLYSDGLLHSVLPLDTLYKNNFFLYGKDAPSFLG
ncbi:hypothetical protein EI613_32650 (plasmid) [Azospirillum sp. 412522]|nr:DUF3800 domain-containing protein [Azospirillum sp. 412522]MBY6266596.1 hypothetical protein [Azospirillum sp. 412522]